MQPDLQKKKLFLKTLERDKTAGEVAAGVAAGVAGRWVVGRLLGTFLAPVVGGIMTYQFATWGDQYSDQSGEEECSEQK